MQANPTDASAEKAVDAAEGASVPIAPDAHVSRPPRASRDLLAGRGRARRRRDAYAALRPLILPLVVGLPGVAWVAEATRRASLETLGRDQGIFQYIAMALGRGAVDYRDVRDVNGPLTHLIHMIFLALGGADEHRFRVLDLTITGASFAIVGACLPGLSRASDDRRPNVLERLAWAFAAWVILSSQYLRYLFWDLAQRESFFDWFMLVSVALEVAALSSSFSGRQSSGRWTRAVLLVVAGATSVLPWFGKPTYTLFTFAEIVTLIVARERGERLFGQGTRRDLGLFLAGGAAGSLVMVGFLAIYADIGAFARIYFVDVPRLYRFIWPRTPIDALSLPGVSTIAILASVTSLAMLGLILDGQLPRRLLAVALVPLAGLASVVVQAKGFPYHFHPVSAGLYLNGLVLVVWLEEQVDRVSPRAEATARSALRLVRMVPFGAASTLSLAVTLGLLASPHLENWWILQKGVTPELRQSKDYLVYFRTADFFPWEMRETAAYLRAHTAPSDTVQTYGMDPYVLFLADRMSATPYIYAYDLDVDAALFGSALPEGLHPTWEQQAQIQAIRDAHEVDFRARLVATPPAAFVFFDRSPLMSEDEDAWLDFALHCPESAAWVAAHYKQTAQFGDDWVWLRNDVADGLPTIDRAHVRHVSP